MTNMFMRRVEKLLDGLPVSNYAQVCQPIKEPTRSQHLLAGAPSEFELHNQVLQNTWGRIEFEIERPIQSLTECSEVVNKKPEGTPSRSEYDCRVRVKTRYRMAVKEQLKERAAKQISTDDSIIEKPESNSAVQKGTTSLDERIAAAKAQARKEFRCRESRRMQALIAERKANTVMAIEKNVFVSFSLPVLSTLARSAQTPQSALKWLAFHESAAIRKSVAKNLSTDLEVLEILAHDENEGVRLAVAENPRVTKEFLLRLLNDDASIIVDKAKCILHNLTRDQANESNLATLKALTEFVDGDDNLTMSNDSGDKPDFLHVVASTESTPGQRLKQLAKHDDWQIRRAVAANPSTTANTLSCLAKDSVLAVRKQVFVNSKCPPEIILNMS